MILTSIISLESVRKKFFMNSTYIMSRENGNQTFLGSGDRNDSNTQMFARIGEKKFFMNSTYIMSRENGNQTFLGSGGQYDSNTHQFARISEKKIFHELDVHHV